MNSEAFADVIDATATLPSGGCSQLLRHTYSPPSITHILATITTYFRRLRDISHPHPAISRVRTRLGQATVATHPVYKLQ
jgi:hypothetical protein